MSIWSSTQTRVGLVTKSGLGLLPERDDYTGEPEGEPHILVDVATTWHTGIRLLIDGDTHADAILSIAEAEQLIAALTEAIVKARSREAATDPTTHTKPEGQ